MTVPKILLTAPATVKTADDAYGLARAMLGLQNHLMRELERHEAAGADAPTHRQHGEYRALDAACGIVAEMKVQMLDLCTAMGGVA